MDGIEPHWNKIRTLILDSPQQFRPKDPLPFDLTKGSPFQKQLQEVYEIGEGLTDEQVEIAKFWDCNPYVTHHRGHAMFATKKITPGGHWIGITGIVTRKAESSFIETVDAYLHVSVALFDAFISCWDEKWNTLVVRPETLINKHYDEEWMPLLQTPLFRNIQVAIRLFQEPPQWYSPNYTEATLLLMIPQKKPLACQHVITIPLSTPLKKQPFRACMGAFTT